MRLSLPGCLLPGFFILAFSAIPFLSQSSRAQSPVRIGRIAQHYADRDGFSGTVTFATAGKVIFRRGYGFADHEHKVPFDEHTRFNIGSISKQFTAAAVLLLQQEGKLKTQDRVRQLLPDQQLPDSWSEITLRELLSHTSGLKDYAGAGAQEMQREHTPAELLALVKNAPLEFKPGDGFKYSNTNYLLLAMVIERAAGMPYCQFLHKRLFDPLGLHDTQCLGESRSLEHHAIGYDPVDAGEGKPLLEDPPTAVMANSFFFGAGSLVSTGDDLLRWTYALHHGQVLSEASYQEMTTPVRNGFGYGLQIGSIRGHMRIDHDGTVPGFSSELEFFPGRDNAVVILSNQDALSKGQFTPGTHEIDSELMTLAAEPNASVPSEAKETPVSPRVLRLYTGRYVADDGKEAPFTISLKGDHLQLLEDGPGHSPSTLREDYGELDFYFANEEADLEFSGQNEAVIFDLRHNRAIAFHRVGSAGSTP